MNILYIVYVVIGIILALISLIPVLLKFVKSVKRYNGAKTEAEAEKAYNDMYSAAQNLIKEAEIAYAGIDGILKAQGTTAGSMKKNVVATQLEAYAINHGYDYDAEFWSTKIDEIVNFTHSVNAHK